MIALSILPCRCPCGCSAHYLPAKHQFELEEFVNELVREEPIYAITSQFSEAYWQVTETGYRVRCRSPSPCLLLC